MTRTRRRTRKVNLRKAYEMGGYTCCYSRFIRERVVPVIGERSLHRVPSREGSRVREYEVTNRNFHRIVTYLGIDTTRYKQVRAVSKAVGQAGALAAAEVILKLVEQTVQPSSTEEYPLVIRVPVHPISNNMQYKASRGRLVSTDLHRRFKQSFKTAIESINPDMSSVDFSKPVYIHMHFAHREVSDSGNIFDRNNFQKASIDSLFSHIGRDDSLVLESSMSGEYVDEYLDGFIEYRIRNL